MTSSVSAFARSVAAAADERIGFTATQAIQSGPLSVEAAIRQSSSGRRSLRVEYATYQNPWTELEETLTGQLEFTGDELCGLVLHRQGQTTWVHDLATDVAIQKLGSTVFEPIPGLATLGELSFLHTLARDFLLRDLGEHDMAGQRVRRFGLKPKQPYRSHLLSTTTFPIRHATIDFHTETYFPIAVTLVPSSTSPAASIVGPDASIHVSYKDVRLLESADLVLSFAPPPDTRIFKESRVPVLDLAEILPFSTPLLILSNHGFVVGDSSVLLSLDADNEKAFATATFSSSQPSTSDEDVEPRLIITFGNYVSRNMARRRATFSEHGTPATQETCPARLLDRRILWEERFSALDTKFAPVEAFFEKEGVFWFLSGTGMDLDAIQTIAAALFDAEEKVT